MPIWSAARPARPGDRCKYTKRYEGLLRARFAHLLGRRGIVRMVREQTAHVRWDDEPGVLSRVCMRDLVLESYDGPDPLPEDVVHVDEITIYNFPSET